MNYTVANVFENPVTPATVNNYTGLLGGTPGLYLDVNPDVDGFVRVAEIDSSREDLLYGSFRTSLWLTSVNGTCAAIFWVSMPPTFAN